MIFAFDQWFLDKYERFAQWFQMMFGPDCFFLARACFVLAYIVIVFGAFIDGGIRHLIPASILTLAPLVGGLLLVRVTERRVWEEMNAGLSNFLKTIGLPLRMVMVLFFSLGTTTISVLFQHGMINSLLFCGVQMLLTSVMYLVSCDPLPSVKSRVRRALEKLREKLSFSRAPVPQES